MSDLRELYNMAEAVMDTAEAMFLEGLGADPAHMKSQRDFATVVDLEIERFFREALLTVTDIPVIGEEYGGDKGRMYWIVDPIDGTTNFAAGNPMSSILMSLILDGEPVIGLTSVPVTRQRFGAFKGSPLFVNGKAQPPVKERPRVASHVGFSSVSAPGSSRIRQGLLNELTKTNLRPRITGSVGVDLAYTAAGIFGGAISFSPYLWDNAAGVVLCRAAGATVTDLNGKDWAIDSGGVVVGAPVSHTTIRNTVETLKKMGV